ncbi:hypothetical protein QFC20_006058 [Naganishia adeliensis]|uniref:Uncharacterized protein n=1 Tax=Naganishia adeliensis TaxID=92952 RepID=A0ACC2VHI5_9TREE|nr:hypothetical protein QFC20_006058 [Naganishia adeliensis]
MKFEDMDEHDQALLNEVASLTPQQVGAMIEKRLRFRSTWLQPLPADDFEPLKRLFEMARDDKNTISARQDAARLLEELGLIGDADDVLDDVRFDLVGYIRLRLRFAQLPGISAYDLLKGYRMIQHVASACTFDDESEEEEIQLLREVASSFLEVAVDDGPGIDKTRAEFVVNSVYGDLKTRETGDHSIDLNAYFPGR